MTDYEYLGSVLMR